MNTLVTGATGFVGRQLVRELERPTVLSRDAARAQQALSPLGATAIAWHPEREPPPPAAFDGAEAVIHLAGDPVADGRWTRAKKARIRDSRVLGTRNLVAGLRACATRPQVLVSASAIGWYGSRGDEVLDEQAAPGHDFLAEVCAGWEQEALAARELGVRVVLVRIGVVLGQGGGALARMLTPFRLGLGSPLGSGRQYMSWIHLHDLVELLLFAARDQRVEGPLNAVAPNPVTNREFTAVLGRVLGRPTFLPPVPALALKLLMGQFCEVLLASQRVEPRAALDGGFVFKYPQLEPALADILRASRGHAERSSA